MNLTENQERIMAEFIADHNGGEWEDYMDIADTTRDEFECFDGREWNEWKGQSYEDRGGFRGVHYDSVQALKGQPRVSLWVIDFGDFRAVYQM